MTKEKNLADLHEWLLESDAGDTKEFLAGKEQRKTLHKHCDHLVKTNRDLILSHETEKEPYQSELNLNRQPRYFCQCWEIKLLIKKVYDPDQVQKGRFLRK